MWFISAVAPGAAYVLDPAADDVDQAALALVGAGAGGLAGRLERAGDVDAGTGLVAEHRQRGVGEGEAGVERRGLLQPLLGSGLEPHQSFETGVVGRGGLGRGRQRQPERVARPRDRVVPADQPAVGQPPRQRGDLVEHRHRHLGGLGPDLGDGGRLPQLAAADAAERPDRCLGRPGRVDEPARLGAEPHPGRARPAERHAAASGEQVVEERVGAGRQARCWCPCS